MNETDALQSYLTFSLAGEWFAAPVGKVFEILEIPRITKIPKSPDFMRGVISLRGQALIVVDGRSKFGMPHTTDTVDTCIVVLDILMEGKGMNIGVVVDEVHEVLELEEDAIQPLPSIGEKFNTAFIQGMVKDEDRFIMLLDLDQVFSQEEVSILQGITQEIKQQEIAKEK